MKAHGISLYLYDVHFPLSCRSLVDDLTKLNKLMIRCWVPYKSYVSRLSLPSIIMRKIHPYATSHHKLNMPSTCMHRCRHAHLQHRNTCVHRLKSSYALKKLRRKTAHIRTIFETSLIIGIMLGLLIYYKMSRSFIRPDAFFIWAGTWEVCFS